MGPARTLPADLPPALAAGYPGARFEALAGGRSNRLWRVTTAGGEPMVVKLHDEGRANPLFPNAPGDEARALRALAGTGLAPRLISETPWLSYAFAPGEVPCRDHASAARTLARLHALPVPEGLRQVPGGHAAVLALGDTMAAGHPDLTALRPDGDAPPWGTPAFLHGDPVPANIVKGEKGAVLIDWQCPAAGDPCEDLAVFLSPAMQSLYGGAPLTPDGVETFLAAYGDPTVAARYRALAPAFHWRMAAYCLWMADRGHADYAAASRLEIAALG